MIFHGHKSKNIFDVKIRLCKKMFSKKNANMPHHPVDFNPKKNRTLPFPVVNQA